MQSRRERLRADTIRSIKAAALQQIETGGASEMSLRAVGREIGMSVAGLYRYYDNKDALLTALIADAFDDLAQAVSQGATNCSTAKARLVGGAQGYRRWSLDNPNQFMLVFGTPIPGYAAPDQGPTVEAVVALGIAWGEIVASGIGDGSLDAADWDKTAQVNVEALRNLDIESSPEGVRVVMAWWGFVHGLVVLEMAHHFAWAIADPQAFFREELERWLEQL